MALRPKIASRLLGKRGEGASDLASAYSDLTVTSWPRLKDDDDYSQLRKKFWGKTIEEEAKHWRETHPTVKDDDTNDIGAECYGLDLGIIGIENNKLWVRQDYIRIYDYCVKYHEESLVGEKARSVVITGQPGVGVFFSCIASCTLSNNHMRKKENFLDHLRHPSLSRRTAPLSLACRWILLLICRGWSISGKCRENRGPSVYPILMGVYRCGSRFRFYWCSHESHWCNQTFYHIHLLPESRSMVECDEEYRLGEGRYGCMVSRRDAPSVSKLVSLLHGFILIHDLILHSAKFLGFTKEQQDVAEDYFENLGPIPRMFISFVRNPARLPDYKSARKGNFRSQI